MGNYQQKEINNTITYHFVIYVYADTYDKDELNISYVPNITDVTEPKTVKFLKTNSITNFYKINRYEYILTENEKFSLHFMIGSMCTSIFYSKNYIHHKQPFSMRELIHLPIKDKYFQFECRIHPLQYYII